MNSIYSNAVCLLENGQSFALAVILSQDGSAPRTVGTKMLILADSIIGTVGGGGVEGDVIRLAREQVLPSGKPVVKFYNLRPEESANANFICGGIIELLVARVDANENNLAVLKAARDAEFSGETAWLFIILDGNEGAETPFRLCVNLRGEKLVGQYAGNELFQREMLKSPIRAAIHGDSSDGIRYICEAVHSGGLMYLFGAGHVSQAVARLAVNLGFRVVVIDDRPEFANEERFPGCEIMVSDSFLGMPDLIVNDSYLLIMTRGHMHDRTVLEWALKQHFLYLGMIGSKTKRDTMYETLTAQGVSAESLKAVHCPIGLAIGAETPAEIAVSIMAEIIAEKRKATGNS